MSRRCGGDGPRRAVRGESDALGFGHGGDFASFSRSGVRDVDAGVVDEFVFDERSELPLGGELVAGGYRHCRGYPFSPAQRGTPVSERASSSVTGLLARCARSAASISRLRNTKAASAARP